MSYGQSQLNALLHDSSITALLTDGDSGIFYDTVVPDETTDSQDATINYYRVAPVNGGLNYLQVSYSVNCRAKSMSAAEAISRAVFLVLNRHSNDSVYFVVSVLATLSPADSTDNYNSPVEAVCKGREL